MGVRGALPARYRGRPLFARTARGGDKPPIPVRAALRDEWSGVGTARCGRCPRDRSLPAPGPSCGRWHLRPGRPRYGGGGARGRAGDGGATVTPSGAGAAGLLPGGCRRVWGCLEGCSELEGSWEQGKGEQGEAASGAAQAVSPHVPSLCPLTTSPSHLPLFPLMFPHLPLSSLTSFLSSLFPPFTSSHVPLPSPLMPRPSSPHVSPHCLSSLCPLLSPHHLPVSSLLVISPCLPSHPFTTSPAVSLCPLTACPSSPFTSPAVPGARGRSPSQPGAPGPQRGRGSVTHFPPGPASLPPWPRAGGANREPQHSSGTGDRAARPRLPSVRDPRGWLSVCRAPDPPGVTVCVTVRVTVPCCGSRARRRWEHLPYGSPPAGRRLSWGHTKPCSGVRAGFVAEGRVLVVAGSERGRLALPRGRAGAARSGRLSLQIPTVRCCRRWRKSFWEGDDDRLMKPIKQ